MPLGVSRSAPHSTSGAVDLIAATSPQIPNPRRPPTLIDSFAFRFGHFLRRRHGVSPCSVAWRRRAASRRAAVGSRQVACLHTTSLPSGAAFIIFGLRASCIQAHVFFDADCCCNCCRCPSLDTSASDCAAELYSPLAESVFPSTWDAKSVLWPESF